MTRCAITRLTTWPGGRSLDRWINHLWRQVLCGTKKRQYCFSQPSGTKGGNACHALLKEFIFTKWMTTLLQHTVFSIIIVHSIMNGRQSGMQR